MEGDDASFVVTAAIAIILSLLLSSVRVRRMVISWVARTRIKILAREQTIAHPANNKDSPSVDGLYIYPVKSLRAVSVERATIDSLGFVGDRRFMLVSPSPPPLWGSFGPMDATHRFVTQRQCPSLATIEAKLLGECETLTLTSASARPKKEITLDVSQSNLKGKPVIRAGIWSDTVEVVDVGDDAAAFVQSVIAKEPLTRIRLVSMASSRPSDDQYVPPAARTLSGGTPQVALSDGFPLLIACSASLSELNRRLVAKGKPSMPMSRFRPNIVIQNTQPFEEDTWKAIQIGNTILHVVKGCPRCKQSCTDQETGKVSDEPLATLAEFRALGQSNEDVYFAQNAIAQSLGTTISVGDSVRVLTRGEPVWDKDKVQAQ